MTRLTAAEARELFAQKQREARRTVAEYLSDRLSPARKPARATPASLARLQRNAADPAKARRGKAALGREGNYLTAITDFLTLELGPEGRGWFRLQSGSVPVRGGYMRLCPEGTADLLAVIPKYRHYYAPTISGPPLKCGSHQAVFCWIEVKRPGGQTSKTRAAKQAAFRADMQALGCLAIQASSVEDVAAVIPRRAAAEELARAGRVG